MANTPIAGNGQHWITKMTNLDFRTKVEDMLLAECSSQSPEQKELVKAVALVFHNFVRILSHEIERLQSEIERMKGVN